MELPKALENEGHPIIWYLLLRLAHAIYPDPVVLKIISILIAFVAVAFFLFRAPFPVWIKILFSFGLFPIYEYSVMTRNYGISMLLLFFIADRFNNDDKRPLTGAVLLAFLANTHVHSCVFALILLGAWNVAQFVRPGAMPRAKLFWNQLLISGIVILGAACSLAIALPNKETIATDALTLSASQVIDSFRVNVFFPGRSFLSLFDMFPKTLAFDTMIAPWLLTLGLIEYPILALTHGIAMISLGMVFDLIYSGYFRHQGLFLMLSIALYWIALNQRGADQPLLLGNNQKYVSRILHFFGWVILVGILAYQVFLACAHILVDVEFEMTSFKAAGEMIASRPELRDAIMISEPDYIADSFPYYANNLIYIPRENVFRKFVRFTKANKQELSLSELMEECGKIREKMKKPVLIALGHAKFTKFDSGEVVFNFRKIFSWTMEDKKKFLSTSKPIGSFWNAVDRREKFDLFLFQ